MLIESRKPVGTSSGTLYIKETYKNWEVVTRTVGVMLCNGDSEETAEVLFTHPLPLRVLPDKSARVVHTGNKGARLQVLDVKDDETPPWLKVRTPDGKQAGWVMDGQGLQLQCKGSGNE